MSEIFLKVVNMSISAGWLILAVLVLRLLLKKAPKWAPLLLWTLVALRLVLPFAPESMLSLIPSAQTVSPQIMLDWTPQINTGIPLVNNAVNPAITGSFAPNPGNSANPLQILIPVAANLWLLGILIMVVYTLISYISLSQRMKTAVLLRENIYQSEHTASAFVFGLVNPRIYLPFDMEQACSAYVIAHEKAHIKRKDHWWKLIGFLVLTIHWFSPLVWVSYLLFCRDIELACDARVAGKLDPKQRAEYSQALLNCAGKSRVVSACPIAFGEVGIKSRIRSVLQYKRPAFWVVMLAAVICIGMAVCFLTDPADKTLNTIEDQNLSVGHNTWEVWQSDGFSYNRIGAVDPLLLDSLGNISVTPRALSQNRNEDRDKTHTLVLQSYEDAQATIYSYLKGLYIHFNEDFTEVWIHDGVKPTLSHGVSQPEAARELYHNILDSANTQDTVLDLQLLQKQVPMYFHLDTTKGLEVYVWQMGPGGYSCGLLSGKNLGYSDQEVWLLHKHPLDLRQMRAVVDSYGIPHEMVRIIPITMPYSSYLYTIDEHYRQNLEKLFWGIE